MATPTMNPKQKYALECMKRGQNIFLTGPGGVGKTLVIKMFADWARNDKYKLFDNAVAVTSTTGSSAVLIGGTTLHSFAGIGLGEKSVMELIELINKKFFVKRRWMRTKVLIIDEVSMMKPELFEKLEEIARILKRNQRVFGGIQVILSADFAQLPPPNMTRFCFESELWDKVVEECIYLKEIMRQDDIEFQKCLNEIRIGECGVESKKLLDARVGVILENDLGVTPTMLYSVNKKVDAINNKYLKELLDKGNENHVYEIRKKLIGVSELEVKPNLLPVIEKMVDDMPAEKSLHLAVGSQVMVIINNKEKELVNGSRGVVSGFEMGMPMVTFLDGRTLPMGWHKWEADVTETIKLEVLQIPMKLSNCQTIHKGQGMSIDYVRTSIDSTIFEYGQAYTALSRCRNLKGLTLDKFDPMVIKCHPKVKEFYEKLENMKKKTIDDYMFSNATNSNASSTTSSNATNSNTK